MEKILRSAPLDARNIRIVEPYPITFRFRVKSEFEGNSLLDLMSVRFPFHGMKAWETKIKNGHVGVNGNEVSSTHLLSGHDEVYHHNPKVIEPAVPDEVKILKETEDYLIVYKPAPMPMHPGGRYNKNSLVKILEEHGYGELHIVHRLDAVTSGLVLFARTKTFANRAMTCFSELKVKKTYFAHVAGVPGENFVTINSPIRRKNGFVFESDPGLYRAKEAITDFEVVERRSNSTIIKCSPKTGRTHQIRLHLEKWGYPIIDDPIYGIGGDKSSKSTQKAGISLINAGLEIEELGVKWDLDFYRFEIKD